jgi:hypothetical protein
MCRDEDLNTLSVYGIPCTRTQSHSMDLGDGCFVPPLHSSAAFRSYPWGSELLATLKAHTPPAVDINMQLLGPLHNGQGYSCQITVARQGPAAGAAQQQLGALGRWAANSPGGAGDGLPSTVTSCKLLVGCTGTDELVLYRHVVLEKMESPTQVNTMHSS